VRHEPRDPPSRTRELFDKELFSLSLSLSISLALSISVERYNPQENRWHTVSPMGTRRKHLGCAVYQDMIYSVGGRDDTTELSSAERYNPRTNQWSPVVAMTSRRSGVSAWESSASRQGPR